MCCSIQYVFALGKSESSLLHKPPTVSLSVRREDTDQQAGAVQYFFPFCKQPLSVPLPSGEGGDPPFHTIPRGAFPWQPAFQVRHCFSDISGPPSGHVTIRALGFPPPQIWDLVGVEGAAGDLPAPEGCYWCRCWATLTATVRWEFCQVS